MHVVQMRRLIGWGLLLFGASFAPSAPRYLQEQPQPVQQPSLSEERLRAAQQQYDLIWQYYQQSRVESFDNKPSHRGVALWGSPRCAEESTSMKGPPKVQGRKQPVLDNHDLNFSKTLLE